MPDRPFVDRAGDLKHPFHADIGYMFQGFLGCIGIDCHLDDAVAVAQIEKNHAAMVAATMDPARDG